MAKRPEEEWKSLQIPFTGPWQPVDDPLLLDKGAFSDSKNMRYTDKSIKGVAGYSKINTAGVIYPKLRSGFHFKKDDPAESHVLIQAFNNGASASKIFQNVTAIPNQGDFDATALHADAADAGKGRFAAGPQGHVIYCNGEETMIWPGDEGRCLAFITSTEIIGDTITNARDYTQQIQNRFQISDEVANIGGGASCSMLLEGEGVDGSTTIIDTTGNHSPTASGSAEIDTDHSKFGLASIYMGSKGYVYVGDHADWSMGTGRGTIDLQKRFDSVDIPGPLFQQFVSSTSLIQFSRLSKKTVQFVIRNSTGGVVVKGDYEGTFESNVFYHFAIIKGWNGSANEWAVTVNGKAVGTATSANPWPDLAAPLEIGRSGDDWSKVADPSTLPTGLGCGVAFSPDGSLMAVAHSNSPYVTIYNTSDWSKVSDPSTLPVGGGNGVAFSPDGSLMAVAHSNSPYVTIYNTSDWSKVSDPSTLPAGGGCGVAFSPDGSLMAVAHSNSPYVTIYNTSDWSKVSNPSTLPPGTGHSVAFNHDSSLMAVGHFSSPYVTIYNTSDWSKVSDPSSLATGTGMGVAFSPDGSLMAVAHYTSPYVTIYNTSDWSKVSDPSTLPASTGDGVVFNQDGSLMAVAHVDSPYVTIYNTSDWSKVADPGTLPGAGGNGVAFNYDGSLMAVAHSNSPCVTIYNPRYYCINTHVDELRVWKGTAAWISDFSPPSRPYGTASGYWLVGSPLPLQGGKFYIKNPNTETSVLTVEEWSGAAWSALTVTDNTASGGITLAQTGTVTWASTVNTSRQKYIDGSLMYWYQFHLSAGSAAIYHTSLDAALQPITNIWDLTPSVCVACKLYDGTTFQEYSDQVNSPSTTDVLVLDNLATTSYALLGFLDRQQGFEIAIPAGKGNSTAATTLSVYFWAGSEWQAVSALYDGTSQGSISFSRSGVITFGPVGKGQEFTCNVAGERLFYYYKLQFDKVLYEETEVFYISGIPATEKILPYKFPFKFQNRILLCNRNEVLISAENAPYIFNGPDSVKLYFGSNDDLMAGAALFNRFESSIYAIAVLCKKSETWILEGYSPDTFRKYQISDIVGCPAPDTMDTCELASDLNIAIWASYDGPVMFDGASLRAIKGVECYFDRNDSRCINYDAITVSQGKFDPLTKEYNLLIPSGSGQATNNVWLVCDTMRGFKWFKKEPPVFPQSLIRVEDVNGAQYLYLGFDDGYMRRNEHGTTFDGTAISQSVTLWDIVPTNSIWDEVELGFMKLICKAKNAGASVSIDILHFADGNEASTSLRSVPMHAAGKRYKQDVQRVNETAVSHQLKLECSTSDKVDGFEPIGLGLLYKFRRINFRTD